MNRCVEQQPQNRREMLCSAARGAALGGLALLSAALIVRGRRRTREESCPLDYRTACAGCAALARCQLVGKPPEVLNRDHRQTIRQGEKHV